MTLTEQINARIVAAATASSEMRELRNVIARHERWTRHAKERIAKLVGQLQDRYTPPQGRSQRFYRWRIPRSYRWVNNGDA